MSIVPAKLEGVIANWAYTIEPRARNLNKPPLCTMTLTKGTGTVTAQVFFGEITYMAVTPGDPYQLFRLNMIDLSWI